MNKISKVVMKHPELLSQGRMMQKKQYSTRPLYYNRSKLTFKEVLEQLVNYSAQ